MNTTTFSDTKPAQTTGFFLCRLSGRLTNRWLLAFRCEDGKRIDLARYASSFEARAAIQNLQATDVYEMFDVLLENFEIALGEMRFICDEWLELSFTEASQ